MPHGVLNSTQGSLLCSSSDMRTCITFAGSFWYVCNTLGAMAVNDGTVKILSALDVEFWCAQTHERRLPKLLTHRRLVKMMWTTKDSL